MKQQISSYNDTGKLITHPYIPCITDGCDSKTTCFGQNLQNKIVKAGGLEELLRNFKCRQCRGGVVISGSRVRRSERKKRITKAETRAALVQEMICSAPKMNFSTRKPAALLKDSPDIVHSITVGGSCIRPDIFLDSGRQCDDCCYNTDCQSTVKTFSKNYKTTL